LPGGPTTFLIRPDGYVGAIATNGAADTVLDTFRRLPAGDAAADRVEAMVSRGDGVGS
jgi:hypothetical protein